MPQPPCPHSNLGWGNLSESNPWVLFPDRWIGTFFVLSYVCKILHCLVNLNLNSWKKLNSDSNHLPNHSRHPLNFTIFANSQHVRQTSNRRQTEFDTTVDQTLAHEWRKHIAQHSRLAHSTNSCMNRHARMNHGQELPTNWLNSSQIHQVDYRTSNLCRKLPI